MDEMPQQVEFVDQNKTTKSRKKWIVVSGVVLLGLLIAGLIFERIAVAWLPNSRAVVQPKVCTIDDIAIFNKRFDDMQDSFSTVSDAISDRGGHESDVNCAFMQYRYLYDKRIYSKATEEARRVQELVEQGQFIDNRIDDVQSLKSIQARLDDVRSLPDGRVEDDWTN